MTLGQTDIMQLLSGCPLKRKINDSRDSIQFQWILQTYQHF
ncbi:hypothetical protein M5D96_010118, partial [Drosophila gunungcola]